MFQSARLFGWRRGQFLALEIAAEFTGPQVEVPRQFQKLLLGSRFGFSRLLERLLQPPPDLQMGLRALFRSNLLLKGLLYAIMKELISCRKSTCRLTRQKCLNFAILAT